MNKKNIAKNIKKEKPFYLSKTMWINALGLASGVLLGVQGELLAGGSLTIGSLVNIVLRCVSDHRIK